MTNSTADTYDRWLERTVSGQETRPTREGEVISTSSATQFGTVDFVQVERDCYLGEVGKRGNDYIYHFFGKNGIFPSHFEDKMGDAFLEVFKLDDRVQASFVPDMNSWAVRVSGYASNPMSDELALKLFAVLTAKLRSGY